MNQKLLRIDEVAVKTGLTKRALRYYEDLQLISPIRTEASYRLYSEADVDKIHRIIEIRDTLGFCLNDIKEILSLEKNLQDIFSGHIDDDVQIEKSLVMLRHQISLIEIKEQILVKVKLKYNQDLFKLNSLDHEKRKGRQR